MQLLQICSMWYLETRRYEVSIAVNDCVAQLAPAV